MARVQNNKAHSLQHALNCGFAHPVVRLVAPTIEASPSWQRVFDQAMFRFLQGCLCGGASVFKAAAMTLCIHRRCLAHVLSS